MGGVVRRGGSGLALVLALLLCSAALPDAHAAPGDLDTSWDGDGKLTLSSGSTDAAFTVLVQPDGKIVAGGRTDAGGGASILWRHNPDGTPDPAFNGGAPLVLPGNASQGISDVTLAPDGKIVAIGNGVPAAVIYRVTQSGALDSSFSGDGWTVPPIFSDAFRRGFGVAVQADGKIVAVGDEPLDGDSVVWRFEAGGPPDASFDNDGAFHFPAGASSLLRDVGIEPTGLHTIDAAGTSNTSGDGFILRISPSNQNDFQYQAIDSGGVEQLNGLAIAPDGKVVVVGGTSVNSDAAFYRLSAFLELDTSFDSDGAFIPAADASQVLHGVAVQPDGKIVAVGETLAGNSGVAYRVTSGGALDPGFSGDGTQPIDNGGDDNAYGVAVAPDGKIVVAADTTTPAASGMIFRLLGGEPSPAAKCKKKKKHKKKRKAAAAKCKKKKKKKKRK